MSPFDSSVFHRGQTQSLRADSSCVETSLRDENERLRGGERSLDSPWGQGAMRKSGADAEWLMDTLNLGLIVRCDVSVA